MSVSMLKGLHRRAIGLSVDDQVMGAKGFVAGGDETPGIVLPGNPEYAALFDDFLGDLVADEWAVAEGDTGHTQAIQTGTNGVFRLTNSIAVVPADTSNQALSTGAIKQWKPNQGRASGFGRLRLSARIKQQTVDRTAGNRMHVFVGFSDSGGAEMPAFDTGAGIISHAADLVGFLFSPGGDTGWSLISAKSTAGDSGDQLVVADTGPHANVYNTLELEVRTTPGDSGATAHFWINGVKKGSINSPVGSAITLAPWIGCFPQDTGDTVASFLDIDYVAVSAPRDTGL